MTAAKTGTATAFPRDLRTSVVYTVAWSAFVVVVDVTLARVAFGSIVPSLRLDLGLSLAAVGLANTANLLGYLAGSPLAARVIARVGLGRATVLGHLLASAGALVMARSPGLAMLAAARIVTGAGGALALIAGLRLAMDVVAVRQRVFASTASWSGVGVGILIVSSVQSHLLSAGSWRIAAYSWAGALVIAALATPVAHGRSGAISGGEREERGYLLILLAYVAFGFAFLAFTTFLAVSGTGDPATRWLWLGVASLIGGWSASRVRHAEAALCISLLTGVVGTFATAFHQVYGPFLVGLGLAATPALTTAIVRGRAASARANGAIASSTIAVGLGQLIGPVVAGALGDRFGTVAVPLASCSVFLLGAGLVALDVLSRSSRDPASSQNRTP